MNTLIFNSKIDLWLIILLLTINLFFIFKTYYLEKNKSIKNNFKLLIITLLIWHPLFTTHYKIDKNILLVRSSIFSWRIPINNIKSIKETNTLASSPALSLDRITIIYENKKQIKNIVISPTNKQEFIRYLNSKR
ncbi:PH domain-containing protein [Acinetobacter sp. XS-4]|uniref:PH domain-containing protein n=1 Tax=Acinetobacter sp. XS-4 TaxID=2923375 RepID=UPI00339D6419